jgi:leucyl-tRNA synthetase
MGVHMKEEKRADKVQSNRHRYDVAIVEKKWQEYWEKHPYGMTRSTGEGKKFYCLDMFPYPSGSGLHVGHWRGYVLSDLYARMKVLQGYNVLHPMGWDAFGLPAENDAIKKGIHPQISTERNIAVFKRQLHEVAAIYDWSKELNTTDPSYYQWTQWIFLKMYQAGLAYQTDKPINWCPSCLTGLANEEVIGNACERCGTVVESKKIRQWVLRITEYAEKLLEGLDRLDWPEKVKRMQRNWIGKSEGLLFSALIKDTTIAIQMYSRHFETFAGDTFVVIAPDHPLLPEIMDGLAQKEAVLKEAARMIQERHRHHAELDAEGVFTGRYVIHPALQQPLPLWIAQYVIAEYGTGIVRGNAHDERDFAFAQKYKIPLKIVLVPEDKMARELVERQTVCYSDVENGILLEPRPFGGKRASEARQDILNYCIGHGYAVGKTEYKLRDWIFSRQRYWGEPIPLIHCVQCGIVPVPETELPVELPYVERYAPTNTGESPLALIPEWVNTTCPQCKGPATRETNTMPQWAGSCWYFLRYPTPHLSTKPFDESALKYWLPVDLYVGGIEHAILHLLYARFYVKVLYDLGYVPFDEPFTHLFNQGMVCKYSEKSGLVEKMSKSKGNVVNPDEIVRKYGSDVLRMYILFMGPPELDCEWQDAGLDGIRRFLFRLWDYITDPATLLSEGKREQAAVTRRLHLLLKDVHDRLAIFKPNTVIAAYMEWLNDALEHKMQLSSKSIEKVLSVLSCMAPHIASELLETVLGKQLASCTWPTFDPELAKELEVTIALQVNGKMRGTLVMPTGAQQHIVEEAAQVELSRWITGKMLEKIIFVPNRLINFVVREQM